MKKKEKKKMEKEKLKYILVKIDGTYSIVEISDDDFLSQAYKLIGCELIETVPLVYGEVMIIDKEGKVTDVRVVRGVDPELDEEALRVVSSSPKWKPGRMGGQKVRTSVTIPVEFRLRKKGAKGNFGFKRHSIY